MFTFASLSLVFLGLWIGCNGLEHLERAADPESESPGRAYAVAFAEFLVGVAILAALLFAWR